VLALQTCPEGQTIPATPTPNAPHPAVAPQNALFDVESMQFPLQLISVPGHETWQVPVLHTWPEAHTAPEVPRVPSHPAVAPQYERSVCGLTHVPAQLTRPAWQLSEQAPLAQTYPAGHIIPVPPSPEMPQSPLAPQ
jgi:hypothetical protein